MLLESFALKEIHIWGVVYTLTEALGIGTAFWAILHARTSRGAIAWSVALVSFPFVALPLFWFFRRRRFEGYVAQRKAGDFELLEDIEKYTKDFARFAVDIPELGSLTNMVSLPVTNSNSCQLLIDGKATYQAIFNEIEKATNYVIVQFFIIHNDRPGRELKELLIRKAKAGVRVYFLYDQIGCYDLGRLFVSDLKYGGVNVAVFRSSKTATPLQINFRNHRKLVIADGRWAALGGLNIGAEYLGEDPKLGAWRDTHMALSGPAVQCLQISFVEDWYWASNQTPELDWECHCPVSDGIKVLTIPSGPADTYETWGLSLFHLISSAKKRLWITSPYFVPDGKILAALKLASLRGVDVRIMLPQHPDHKVVFYARHDYFWGLQRAGVQFYIYGPGFMHSKVMLIDSEYSVITSANLDNRSFRLNFELGALVIDREFAGRVEQMLAMDFHMCQQLGPYDLNRHSLGFRLLVKISRLFSPVL